jgi:dTDP-4-amino-4,6-dideoxygalactose transaminase
MSEFNAVLGLASLEMADQNIARRHQLFNILQTRLAKLPGIRFPQTTPGGVHNGVYFSIIIDSAKFGLTRDQLYQALKSDGVDTRRYYLPPLHRQKVNAHLTSMYEGKLPHTDEISATSLTLPMFSHMTDAEAKGICQAIERLHENNDQVRIKCAELAAKG